ncbi:hypothetical protein AQS8620_01331 [Aquimixticola soesokkakensis]|uniref:Uncharacterized protein n=1 Tax=Aquimixticola soesokkakensis TaxID=1519096 RepID=A0A1Y5SG59_9RHOB|nr:hypothetical protein [Aquimixticola soesokkakensis]SLN36937.1 hypothetical protein AQS8620_01331 [Aquimixticola soesokkakensis]
MSLPHNHTGALLCMRGDTATGFKIGTLYAAQDGRIRNDRGVQYSIGTTGNATFQPLRETHSEMTSRPPRELGWAILALAAVVVVTLAWLLAGRFF